MNYTKTFPLLKVDNVNISLGGKKILRDINFEIRDVVRPDQVQGQVVALVGQSGVGKSTLFNILSGLLTPDSGRVLQGVKQVPVRTGDMGVVYQNYYLFGWRKVKTLLAHAAAKNPAIVDEKGAIDAICQDFNLMDHLNKYPCQLSGGQQQRVAIAEQILNGSDFLLLDEPFSGLDSIVVDKVLNMLVKVSTSDELKTLIIISHDLSNAVAISDMVYVLARQEGIEGATITKEIDLIERGLAWQKDIKDMPYFREVLKEIKSLM